MRTFELYFNGPATHNTKLQYEPTPLHMYDDFIDCMKSSGYTVKKASMKYSKNKTNVTIEVIGEK